MPLSYLKEQTSPDQTVDELALANRFTISDLDQNRRGRIADSQGHRLLIRALRPVRYTGSALLGWLIFCLIVRKVVPAAILWIGALLGSELLFPVFGTVTIACFVAFVTAIVKSTHKIALLMADLRAGKATWIEGRISPSKGLEKGLGLGRLYGEERTTWWYVVKEQYFEVSEEAHRALPRGRFRLYYTPRSRMLLSIEPA
jgi:hypothetical protein